MAERSKNKYLLSLKKSKAKVKVEGSNVFFLLCYFKQEKHAHFAAYDSDYRASGPECSK